MNVSRIVMALPECPYTFCFDILEILARILLIVSVIISKNPSPKTSVEIAFVRNQAFLTSNPELNGSINSLVL
jgi:hypothetical protein